MEWQPIVTLISAVIAAGASAITLWKLQDRKRNDDLDLKAFEYSLKKHLKEFEQKLIGENSYLAEKGKNTATKEDIEEVIRKIESIKNEFVTTTELLKWELSKKANLYKLQAEKEFEVYSRIWEHAVELKFAVEQLRPVVDSFDPNEPAREKWLKRYANAIKSGKNLLNEVEKQRPFYPPTLFLQLQQILHKTNEEIVDFEFSLDENQERMSREGYKKGQENLKVIINNLNQVCDLMRSRITETE